MQRRDRATRTTTACLSLAMMLALLATVSFVTAQDADRDAFRQLHNELRQRMDDDLKAATEFLDSKIEADPDSGDLNVLRHSLATKFLQERKFDQANEQFGKLLDFQIKHIDKPDNVFGILMTINSIQEVAEASRDEDAWEKAVDRAFDTLSKVPADQQTISQLPRSQLAVMKAHVMIGNDQEAEAKALIEQQLAELMQAAQTEPATESTTRSLVRMLRALTTDVRENDSWRDEYVTKLVDVVAGAVEKFPESTALQNDYAEVQFLMITRWGQDDPEANKKRIEEVSEKLHLIAAKNQSIRATLRRIDLHKEKMASVKPVATLVGKPAPDWDIDAWVNTPDELTRDSFKGKIVLIDFWAMWCGPCVATFPHLREWREEFGDDGFEIVGVTQYYNFEWDEETKRAARAKEEISEWNERATLASFLEHHKLLHPVIVTPEDSEMNNEYGVRGIPHVVLIDREGVVQLVKTGAGAATAKEIHAKIKELVDVKDKT